MTFELILPDLENIQEKDTYQWVTDLQDASEKAKWSPSQQLVIANNLTSTDIRKQIVLQKNIQELTNALTKLTVDRYSLPSLTSDLQGTKQNKHKLFRDFLDALETRANKVARILESSSRETTQLITTTFFANISSHAAIFLQTKGFKTYDKAKKKLLRLEEIVLSEAVKSFRPPTKKPREETNQITPKCDLHPDSNHRNEECIVRKRQEGSKRRENEKSRRTFGALMPTTSNYQSTATINLDKKEYTALLDSGSAFSLLSSRTFDGLKNKPERSDSKTKLKTVNNEPCETKFSTIIDIELRAHPDTILKTKVVITTNLAYDIILGRDFLEKHNIILNFREGVIQTDHGYIEMPTERATDKLDRELENKLSISLNCTSICSNARPELKTTTSITKLA